MFKSYYVVWKLFTNEKNSTKNTGFKSYYVVWKRQADEYNIAPKNSLNRTMQYGNYFEKDTPNTKNDV